jgi:hypothetical protein
MRTYLVLISVIAALISTPALAQRPACDGDFAVVRVSEIKPSSSMEQYLKALDAHKAWYRSHGFMNNEIHTAKMLVLDKSTNSWKYSDSEIMSFHIRPPLPQDLKLDAAWDAFVRQYDESSEIKAEYSICLPKNP